jgi:DNA polymerase III subunit delta
LCANLIGVSVPVNHNMGSTLRTHTFATRSSLVQQEGAVVLVKGDDPVLRDDTVRELIHAAADGEDLSLGLDDIGGGGEDFDVAIAIDAAQTPPMFTTKRVVVVREIGRIDSEGVEAVLNYLAGPCPTSRLILVAGGGQTSRKISDAVKRIGGVIDTAAPTGKARQGWLDERLAEAPVRLDRAAAQTLTAHLGDSVSRLDGILSILGAVYGTGARIGVDELEPFLGEAGGGAPWDLTDAIDRGDSAAALGQLRRQLGGDRHPLQVMASLTAHFSKMLRLSGSGIRNENDAAAALGMTGSTFPAKKALNQSNKLGQANIARAVQLLAEADLDLRGRRDLPGEVVMEVLVARLARLGATPTRR